jgi:hypothetical protein
VCHVSLHRHEAPSAVVPKASDKPECHNFERPRLKCQCLDHARQVHADVDKYVPYTSAHVCVCMRNEYVHIQARSANIKTPKAKTFSRRGRFLPQVSKAIPL